MLMADDASSVSGRATIAEGASFEDLVGLSDLLFLRGDLMGRIADHDQAEVVANEAVALSPGSANAIYIRARLASRPHAVDTESFPDILLADLLGGSFLVPASLDELQAVHDRFWEARGETPLALTLTTTLDCNLGCCRTG